MSRPVQFGIGYLGRIGRQHSHTAYNMTGILLTEIGVIF